MRALGYYPTEQEVEEMINEVKFSTYIDTKTYVDEIDLNDFIKCKLQFIFYHEKLLIIFFDFSVY